MREIVWGHRESDRESVEGERERVRVFRVIERVIECLG